MQFVFFITTFFLLFAGQVLSIPMPLAKAIAEREPSDVFAREDATIALYRKAVVPEEKPAKAPNSIVEAYKRQEGNEVQVQNAAKNPDGQGIRPYKRQEGTEVKVEQPAKNPDGQGIRPYKRQEGNEVQVQNAAKNPDGQGIRPYKRQEGTEVKVEQPAKNPDGQGIRPY